MFLYCTLSSGNIASIAHNCGLWYNTVTGTAGVLYKYLTT